MSYEFYDYAAGCGYAVYEDEDGFHWEFLESYGNGRKALAGMGPFPTRSKALEEAARDWQMLGDDGEDTDYTLRLLHAADEYRYEEDA